MAVPLGNTTLPGYLTPFGDKILATFDHSGPASYTQFTTPSTGGDKINAADIGVGGFDNVDVMVDTTGQFACYAVLNLGGYGNAVPSVILVYYSLVTATVGGQAQTVGTQVATATNLSTFSFRVQAFCV